jgi:hypothetical protein
MWYDSDTVKNGSATQHRCEARVSVHRVGHRYRSTNEQNFDYDDEMDDCNNSSRNCNEDHQKQHQNHFHMDNKTKKKERANDSDKVTFLSSPYSYVGMSVVSSENRKKVAGESYFVVHLKKKSDNWDVVVSSNNTRQQQSHALHLYIGGGEANGAETRN